MDFVIGIIAFLFMLSVIVVIHELGHMLAAKHFGVYCEEFSVGMGPALYQKKGKETIYSLRAIPIGGYVKMVGENDGSDSDLELEKIPRERWLNHQSTWKQIVIMAAGVCMNFVLAAVLYIGISMAQGYVVEDPLPIVDEVVENSAAQKAGLQSGDQIVQVVHGSETIHPKTLYEVTEFLQFNKGESIFTIEREGKTFDLAITPDLDEENQIATLGIYAKSQVRKIAWYESFGAGLKNMWDGTTSIFRSLAQLVKGKGFENLSGLGGILNVTQKSTQLGFLSYLSLFALISLNIGIFNLLPIPALDGGRILILALERIFNRKINEQLIENIILGSFILLFGIFIFATYNDIVRLL